LVRRSHLRRKSQWLKWRQKKRARDDYDESSGDSGEDGDDLSEEEAEVVPHVFGSGYAAQQQTTLTGGGFASMNPSVSAFGGPSANNPSLAGFAAPPSAYTNPSGFTPPVGASPQIASRTAGAYASPVASLAAFGGPSNVAAAPSTPVRPGPSGYTMTNYGGYASANVIDTPSRGLGALGPQPGGSFGFSTAHSPVPPSAPSAVNVQTFSSSGLSPPSVSAGPAFGSATSKLLLLIALFHKQGRLSAEEKGKLKDRVLRQDSLVHAALDVFEIDQDLDELSDTLRRITAL